MNHIAHSIAMLGRACPCILRPLRLLSHIDGSPCQHLPCCPAATTHLRSGAPQQMSSAARWAHQFSVCNAVASLHLPCYAVWHCAVLCCAAQEAGAGAQGSAGAGGGPQHKGAQGRWADGSAPNVLGYYYYYSVQACVLRDYRDHLTASGIRVAGFRHLVLDQVRPVRRRRPSGCLAPAPPLLLQPPALPLPPLPLHAG